MSMRQDRYDAIISYSQRDAGTVSSLQSLLAGYWVPGKKRRAIFLDRISMAAGVLNEKIRQAQAFVNAS